jgi:hypothetical protein
MKYIKENSIFILIVILACIFGYLLISMIPNPPTYETPKSNIISEEKRHEYFVECMKLSAELKRQGDDDVSDVVEECSRQSYYMTNYLRRE